MEQDELFRKGLGLKTKFLTWLLLFIVAVMAVVYVYFSRHERSKLSNEIKLRGEAICNNLASSAEDFLVMKDDLSLAKLVYDTREKNPGIIYCFVIDNEKKIWAHTDIGLVNKTYRVPPGLDSLGTGSFLSQSHRPGSGIDVFEITMPITVGSTKIGEAHVAISQEAIRNAVTEAGRGLALVTVVIILAGILGILIVVSFIIGSLSDIARDIEAIGDGDLDRNIVEKRRDEIGIITHAVKTMARKLKKAREELIEKERMKKEMQIAREIQHALLPGSIPDIKGFRIAAYYQSAMEVGGDYYDIIEIDKDHFGVIIADVSGKGVAGSLIMTMLRSIMRMDFLKNASPHRQLSMLNSILRTDIPEGMFITLFYAVFDRQNFTVKFCCAGHNPVYHFSVQTRRLVALKPSGPPLGISIFDDKQFSDRLEEVSAGLEPGALFLLYTDGITEAMNRRKELFGTERLENIIVGDGKVSPDELKNTIIAEVEKFTEGEPQADDITFVIVQREEV
jgi:sigma-B regulation protein RsbU (phosphoserine phosphatase)